mgnify:CR=1 FL=1
MSAETITTPLTKFLGITHPVLLAGMNVAAGPELAAAVSNAGKSVCLLHRARPHQIGARSRSCHLLVLQCAQVVWELLEVLDTNLRCCVTKSRNSRPAFATLHCRSVLTCCFPKSEEAHVPPITITPKVCDSSLSFEGAILSSLVSSQGSSQLIIMPWMLCTGTLPELIDIIIEEKATLFVSAVGVPPR